jgi:hypothetical protein
MYKHYIRLDENNNIIYGFSDAFEQTQENDICINENGERHFELLGIVNPSLVTMDGIYLYQYIDNNVVYNANPVISLDKVKENKILELNTACNQSILNGFPSSCTGIEHHYKFDMEYQGNITQQGVMLTLDPTITVVPWPTSDAGVIAHTKDQFIELCKEAQNWKGANIYRYFGLKAQVEACTEIEDAEAFMW